MKKYNSYVLRKYKNRETLREVKKVLLSDKWVDIWDYFLLVYFSLFPWVGVHVCEYTY